LKTISISKARAGMVLAQDVYVSESGTNAFVRRGSVLNWETIDKLWDRGVLQLHVQDASTERPTRAPTSASDARLMSRAGIKLAPPPVSDTLRHEAVDALEETFDAVTHLGRDGHATAGILTRLDTVVGQLVSALMSDRTSLVNIANLKKYDDYTFHHSLSVAVLSIGIGQHLGLPPQLLNHLGLTAMLHDIGKTAIPVDLIRKPSRLDKEEFNLVKAHAYAGSSYLIESAMGTEPLWSGVLYHHEKVDGTGYPNGLRGNEIPLWSRIIAVADVFDALTSDCPYRKPLQPAEALEYIMGGGDTTFDFDMVTALTRRVELYPIGSLVELSNGQYALVVDNDMQLRPVIELVGTGELVDMYRDRRMLSVTVKRIVPETEILIGR